MISRTIPLFDRGGIQTHVYNLSKALARQGVEVDLFIIGKKVDIGKNLTIHPIKAFGFPRLTAGLYATFTLNAARHAKRYDLDLIHGHSMYATGYALMKKKPFVLTLHGTQLSELRATLETRPRANHVMTDTITTLMEKYSISKADRVIVTCKHNFEEVIDQYNIDEEKMRVVYQGVDVERFTPSKCEGKTVLFVGRLHQRKGVDRLLRAFKKVVKEEPEAKLLIAGRGEGEQEYKALAKKLALGASVKFLGHFPEEELPGLYSSASLFVMPSYYEGFGLVLLEGMASGLPVLAFDTGVVPEIIENGRNGFMVEDDNDLADRVLEILADEQKRKAMGKRSRAIVEEKLTWDRTAKGTIEVYKELVE